MHGTRHKIGVNSTPPHMHASMHAREPIYNSLFTLSKSVQKVWLLANKRMWPQSKV